MIPNVPHCIPHNVPPNVPLNTPTKGVNTRRLCKSYTHGVDYKPRLVRVSCRL